MPPKNTFRVVAFMAIMLIAMVVLGFVHPPDDFSGEDVSIILGGFIVMIFILRVVVHTSWVGYVIGCMCGIALFIIIQPISWTWAVVFAAIGSAIAYRLCQIEERRKR